MRLRGLLTCAPAQRARARTLPARAADARPERVRMAARPTRRCAQMTRDGRCPAGPQAQARRSQARVASRLRLPRPPSSSSSSMRFCTSTRRGCATASRARALSSSASIASGSHRLASRCLRRSAARGARRSTLPLCRIRVRAPRRPRRRGHRSRRWAALRAPVRPRARAPPSSMRRRRLPCALRRSARPSCCARALLTAASPCVRRPSARDRHAPHGRRSSLESLAELEALLEEQHSQLIRRGYIAPTEAW